MDKKIPSAFLTFGAVATLSFALLSPAQAADESCTIKPTHIQLSYSFAWQPDDQARLSNIIASECRSASFIKNLTSALETALMEQNIKPRQILVMPENSRKVISIKLVTKADSDAFDANILVPLQQPASGQIITSLDVIGEAVENEELIARYTINENRYQANGGKLVIEWLRDGQPIENAGRSRYILQRSDVGRQISAKLTYSEGAPHSFDEKTARITSLIAAANYPPSIRDLTITGDAETGQTLTATYIFNDDNEGDSEGDTSFIWLRDNMAIAGATGPSYQTGASDIGAQISVRVQPRSQDGMAGAAKTASLAEIVRAKPVEVDQDTVQLADGKALDADALEGRIAAAIETDETSEAETSAKIADDSDEKAIITKAEDKSDSAEIAEQIVTIGKPAPRPAKPQIAPVDDDTKLAKSDDDKAPQLIIRAPTEAERESLAQPEEAEKEPASDIAQADKPAIIIKPLDDEDKTDKPRQDDELEAEKEPVIIAPVPPPTVLTEGFEITHNSPKIFTGLSFTPSNILLETDLKNIERAVKGMPIQLPAIKTVLDEVNALYLAYGFELSRALLPEQTVDDGVVAIQLVEAKVGKIILENRDALDEDFIRNHLAAEEGGFISLAQLEKSIRIYNMSNKSNLATELAPGEAFGETDIFVDVAEPDIVELPSVSVNNHANKTSDWRNNTFSFTANNLFGFDDETAFSFSDASGSSTQSVSFSMPVDYKGSNLSLALTNSDTKIVAGSAETVGYRGSSTASSVSYSTPMLVGDEYSIYLSGTLGSSKSDLVQPETGLMLSKSHVRKFTLGLPYSYNNGTTSFSFAPAWHVINSTTEIPVTDKWVQKIDGDISLSQFLSEKWTANLKAKFLYTDARDMINMPSEILSVGGSSSVRAYQPGESSGYQGYFLSGEMRTDLANWEEVSLPEFMPSAQLYLFADHMMAQTQYKVRNRGDYWSGVGVGLRIPSIFNLLTFDVYWSEPLDGSIHEAEKEFYDEELFQFSLSARFRLQ